MKNITGMDLERVLDITSLKLFVNQDDKVSVIFASSLFGL
jgi:hypothetical protein